MSRSEEMKVIAERYAAAFTQAREAGKRLISARSDEENALIRLENIRADLGKFVGANVTSRAASLKDGTMVVVKHCPNTTPVVELYDSEGERVSRP